MSFSTNGLATTVAYNVAPELGQLVEVRRRQWIVSELDGGSIAPGAPKRYLVRLASIDEDALGEEIEVLWELEPGAHVIERAGLPRMTGLDDPSTLQAFLDEVMNWINNPEKSEEAVIELRKLMTDIDSEVFSAYKWDDLNIEYNFQRYSGRSVNDPWRWALTDDVSTEVLRRLTALNQTKYESEVSAGPHGSGSAGSRPRRQRAASAPTPVLDLGDMFSITIEEGA